METARSGYGDSATRRTLHQSANSRRAFALRRSVAALLLLALLALLAFGVYRLADPGGSPTTAAVGAGAALPDGIAAIVPNGPPQALEIESKPADANISITLQDGTTMTGATPFSAKVPGGKITLTLAKDGYNPVNRELDLQEPQSLTVWLDPEGLLHQSVIRFKCGHGPKQVLFTPDGKELWVSLLGGHGVDVFDTTTWAKIAAVSLGKYGAVEMVFNRAGTKVYISQMQTASVYEVDRVTRKVLRVFKTGGSWTKVVILSPDEKRLYASNWVSDNVSEIDLITGRLVRRIKAVDTPRGLYLTPDGKRLFVAGFEHGSIKRIDLATREGEVIFKTEGAMRHLVADDSRGLLYADDLSTNEVFVVDLATEKVTKLNDTDERPNTMELTPDGRVLYVSCRGKDNPKSYYIKGPEWGSILAFDAATGKILDAIVGGNQCTGLDVSPDGKLLAFSDLLDDTIRIYAVPDYETLVAGGGGRAIAHLEDIPKD
jgi:DNA-binding beta-propeller fold protein YncE